MNIKRHYQNETKVKKYFGLVSERPEWQQMKEREIEALDQDDELPNNAIKTTKYSYATFIPLNLFFQFSKLANAYFLIIGAMQMVNSISITDGEPVIFGPLIIVVSISMMKDFYEDYRRNQSDKEENNKGVSILRNKATEVFQHGQWQDLKVGDVVKVEQAQILPADLVILASSDTKGKAFVETKSLDGETNLKTKLASKELVTAFQGFQHDYNLYQSIKKLELYCKYEGPNPYLYKFNGSICMNEQYQPFALGADNFLLRGSKLMNTQYILGLVVYTGHDTKIMLNSVKGRPKKSHLEELMNLLIILIFCIQMVVSFTAAIYNSQWQYIHEEKLGYLEFPQDASDKSYGLNLLVRWGGWILIFTNFVPISLIVSLEMVKVFQGTRMTRDKRTYSQSTDIRMTVQTSNLNEELGQVQYIFSDKTGTLTKNIMDFKKATIGGIIYEDQSLDENELRRLPKVSNVDFKDRQLLLDLKTPPPGFEDQLVSYMLCLGLCHTIITQTVKNEILYNASSPDELALINFAKLCGYVYMGMDDNNMMTLRVYLDPLNPKSQFKEHSYKLLNVLEFSSARKRMSVILRDSQQRIILYTKGADNVIKKRLRQLPQSPGPQSPKYPGIQKQTWSHLYEFAKVGLRTLVLTQRFIPEIEYEQWANEYQRASTSIKNRDQLIEDVQEKIEVSLELLGGTAIEDKLQDNIGPTIKALKNAQMKIWVLTGDKVETAINIGISCQLLEKDMQMCVIDGVEEMGIKGKIADGKKELENEPDLEHGVVVTGDALIIIMSKDELIEELMSVCDDERIHGVMACRVSPKQKQEIVAMVRKFKPTVTTLAIGDGANDVNMITAAHVGVGIRGVEGQQAARAADYSVGEFQILKTLTLHHGRESYRKNSRLVTYNFYKNMLLVLPQFWWGYNNGFSAFSLYDPLLYQSYNLFFTAIPIIVYAIFDEEFTGEYLEQNPELYDLGRRNIYFNYKVFLFWITIGTLFAAFEGLWTCSIFEGSAMVQQGFMGDLFSSGSAMLGFSIYNTNWKVIIFLSIFSKIFLISKSLSIGVFLMMFLSLLSYWIMYALISGYMVSADNYDNMSWDYSHPLFYLGLFFMTAVTTLMDLGITNWVGFQFYSYIDDIREDKVQIKHISNTFKAQFNKRQKLALQRRGSIHPAKTLMDVTPKQGISSTPANFTQSIHQSQNVSQNGSRIFGR